MGWSKDPGPPSGGGNPRLSRILAQVRATSVSERVLSCFIDESGDFGPYDARSPYYYVSMVLHDQEDDISDRIAGMEARAVNLGFQNHAIHTGPLIRRESVYINDTVEDRKHLFNLLYFFTYQLPIRYISVKASKAECADEIQQTAKLSREITNEIQAHIEYWRSFEKIIVYYDNGQTQLTKIVTSVFNALFSNVEMRKVRPVEYKLFQVADLICTLEMLEDKAKRNSFSHSEIGFFDNVRAFRKNYYSKIQKKRL